MGEVQAEELSLARKPIAKNKAKYLSAGAEYE
jgi:hypothetical protein